MEVFGVITCNTFPSPLPPRKTVVTRGIGGTIWGLSAPNGAPMGRCGKGARKAGAHKPMRAGAAARCRGSTQVQPWRPWPDALAHLAVHQRARTNTTADVHVAAEDATADASESLGCDHDGATLSLNLTNPMSQVLAIKAMLQS
eukprot:366425-Chlamydomonas_euryale.AAC.3